MTVVSKRVRLTPDARREQLLDLGVRMLATRTLDELSVDVLAEEAGISRGLLFHYFKSKQDFHRAVVRRAADDLLARTKPDMSKDPTTRLSLSLAHYIDYVLANYQSYISLVRGAAGSDEALLEIFEGTREVMTARITDNLEVFGVQDSPTVRLMARGWSALVEEAVLGWVADQQLSKEELLRVLTATLPAVLSVG
ncbi:TetR/AcrR family transcriptional regulator [Jatrophihabitans sp.]|jgi:AcrR family transcriptional regulator|uniref:TetR/AcrR family transcriptional regulator n=1 Tax=Jatrophihabitans sp. TaxID=1932789 RepID=UPI002EE5470B